MPSFILIRLTVGSYCTNKKIYVLNWLRYYCEKHLICDLIFYLFVFIQCTITCLIVNGNRNNKYDGVHLVSYNFHKGYWLENIMFVVWLIQFLVKNTYFIYTKKYMKT